jgi:hypothetical protein
VSVTHSVSGIHESHDDHDAGSSGGEKKGMQENDHGLVTSYVNAHAATNC